MAAQQRHWTDTELDNLLTWLETHPGRHSKHKYERIHHDVFADDPSLSAREIHQKVTQMRREYQRWIDEGGINGKTYAEDKARDFMRMDAIWGTREEFYEAPEERSLDELTSAYLHSRVFPMQQLLLSVKEQEGGGDADDEDVVHGRHADSGESRRGAKRVRSASECSIPVDDELRHALERADYYEKQAKMYKRMYKVAIKTLQETRDSHDRMIGILIPMAERAA